MQVSLKFIIKYRFEIKELYRTKLLGRPIWRAGSAFVAALGHLAHWRRMAVLANAVCATLSALHSLIK